MKNVILGLFLSVLSSLSFAQSNYVELSLGKSIAVDVCDNFSYCSDSDTAFKVAVGLKNDNGIGFEASYWSLGEASSKIYGAGGSAGASASASAIVAQILGTKSFEKSSITAKAGFAYANVDYNEYCFIQGFCAHSYDDKDKSFSPIISFSAEIPLNPKMSFVANFDNFFDIGGDDFDNTDIRVFGAGLRVAF